MSPKKKVYVIEDSDILSEILSMSIENQFKCDTLKFSNADLVMDAMSKEVPGLIILDYNFAKNGLNFSNGLDFLRECRKLYDTPIIVFSGQRDVEIAKQLLDSGANSYISKDEDGFLEAFIVECNKFLK